jgi:hypothetical protein
MIRVVVALYLMAVTALGPWLCCCTATRLTARFFSKANSAAQPAPLPAPPCCCHHGQADKGQPDSTDHPGCPQTPGCPCKQGPSNEVAALPTGADEPVETSYRLAAGERLPVPCLHAHDLLAPEVASPATRDATSLPFLSTHDLLRVLHIMRC